MSHEYKGNDLIAFIEAASSILFALGKDVSREKNPYKTDLTSNFAPMEDAPRRDGWDFGYMVRMVPELSFALDANPDNDKLKFADLRWSMYEGEGLAQKCLVSGLSCIYVQMATSYKELSPTLQMLDGLDDLDQFMKGNVKALVGKSDSTDQRLYVDARASLELTMLTLSHQYNLDSQVSFYDIATAIVKRQTLNFIESAKRMEIDSKYS